MSLQTLGTSNNENLVRTVENGFELSVLNNIEYQGSFRNISLSCEYVLPHSNVQTSFASLSILNFNIRSINKNFTNFVTEILGNRKHYEIIGLCETRLTRETEHLYSLNGYIMLLR